MTQKKDIVQEGQLFSLRQTDLHCLARFHQHPDDFSKIEVVDLIYADRLGRTKLLSTVVLVVGDHPQDGGYYVRVLIGIDVMIIRRQLLRDYFDFSSPE